MTNNTITLTVEQRVTLLACALRFEAEGNKPMATDIRAILEMFQAPPADPAKEQSAGQFLSDEALKRFGKSQYRDGYAQGYHDKAAEQASRDAGDEVDLTDEEILLIGRMHFRDDANITPATLAAYCDSVRSIITSYGLTRAPAQQAAPLTDDARDLPSLPSLLTPFGLLVRALRIVAGTTLYDMAKALLTTPAKLSAMELGRAPVTPEFAFDVSAYFDALGISDTRAAIDAALQAHSEGEAS